MSRLCVNKITLIGFVGQDPETRYTTAGDPVASLSVATTESWLDKEKKEQERTEWHRCVAFGKFAENVVGKLPKKGSYVYIEGSNRTRKWQAKDGSERYTTEIVVDELIMLDRAPKSSLDFTPPNEEAPPAE